MAPVKATSVGVTPQIIDDEELAKLLATLNGFNLDRQDVNKEEAATEIAKLVSAVSKYPEWKFEEQVGPQKTCHAKESYTSYPDF